MFHSEENLRQKLSYVMTMVLGCLILMCSCAFASGPVLGQTKHQITEITFEETSNWQGLMAKYVLSRDHTVTMTVPDWKSQTPKVVVFRGKYYDFDRLAMTLENQGFFKLKARYSADLYDANSVIVTAVRNRERKTVVDYGNAGPLNLWVLKQLLRGEVSKLKWELFEKPQDPDGTASRPNLR
jgi:hypothetical protein